MRAVATVSAYYGKSAGDGGRILPFKRVVFVNGRMVSRFGPGAALAMRAMNCAMERFAKTFTAHQFEHLYAWQSRLISRENALREKQSPAAPGSSV